VEAELRCQPVGYRWATNVAEYDMEESSRFISFFDSMSSSSATLVADVTAMVR
jgi:hypothetical protein